MVGLPLEQTSPKFQYHRRIANVIYTTSRIKNLLLEGKSFWHVLQAELRINQICLNEYFSVVDNAHHWKLRKGK